MSEKITKFTNKVSPLIEGQVPDFVQSDHPIFVDFVKDYFKFLEAGRLTLSNVDGTLSTRIRITVIPSSYDIIPVRNQIIELDLVNTSINGSVDAAATTGLGYTTTQSGSSSTTTVTTTSSTPSSSAYW